MDQAQKLAEAIALASHVHRNQKDRQGLPYILHPLKVMYYLKTTDLELMQMAVMHDCIEDAENAEEMKDTVLFNFSIRVFEGVMALTKLPGQDYNAYKQQVMGNRDAMLVKMQDLRHNLDVRRLKNKVLTEKDIERIIKYKTFYAELQEALQTYDHE